MADEENLDEPERVAGPTPPAGSRWWHLLLLLPFVGLLWVPFYATDEPKVWGIPFFYWYQLAWVPVTSLLIWIVYRKAR